MYGIRKQVAKQKERTADLRTENKSKKRSQNNFSVKKNIILKNNKTFTDVKMYIRVRIGWKRREDEEGQTGKDLNTRKDRWEKM